MTVIELVNLLLLSGNLDDEVMIFEQDNLSNGAEVVSVMRTVDDIVLLETKAFED